jgi:hypothetical protein
MATGFDWVQAGGQIAGAVAGMFGNKSAGDSNKKALKFMKQEAARARAERERGRKAALALVSPHFDSTAADQTLGRAMTSRPEVMTPGQKLMLEDATRRQLNNNSVAGMRGAGHGGAAVLADLTRRIMADSYDSNQARSDQAASELAARGERARATGANIETGTSGAIASDRLSSANNAADLIGAQGQVGLANANLIGNTIGAIAQIANQDRSYDKYGKSKAAGAP